MSGTSNSRLLRAEIPLRFIHSNEVYLLLMANELYLPIAFPLMAETGFMPNAFSRQPADIFQVHSIAVEIQFLLNALHR